jgi:hypothetical protein
MKFNSKLIIYPTMKKYGRRGLFGSIEGQSASHASSQNHANDDSSGKFLILFSNLNYFRVQGCLFQPFKVCISIRIKYLQR